MPILFVNVKTIQAIFCRVCSPSPVDRIKSATKSLGLIFLFVVLVGCSNDPEIRLEGYSWTPSTALPDYDGVHKIKVMSDGSLLLSGTVEGVSGLYRLVTGEWKRLTETTGYIEDFEIFQGTLYYSDYHSLYKIADGMPEKLMDTDPFVNSMIAYGNKLFLTGSIVLDGASYTIVTFDGDSFEPVSETTGGYYFNIINGNLLLSNYPSSQFNGSDFVLIDLHGQTNFTYDQSGNVYVAGYDVNANNEWKTYVSKYDGRQSEIVADTIEGTITTVVAFNDKLVVSGYDNAKQTICYYANGDSWKNIKVSFSGIYDMLYYNNSVIALTALGPYELTAEYKR